MLRSIELDYTFRIKRYNPDIDVKPHFEEYTVDLEPNDRVLDALNQIKWHQDGTLTYRRSCAHGVCGSDAMRINGRNRLACKMLMNEFGKKITIEPLIGFAVIKDLVVDMDQFFDGYKAVKPYLIADDAPASVSACRARSSASGTTTPPSASSAPPAPPPARSPGPTRIRRPGRDRQCPPLHLRQPRPGRRRAPAHPQHAVRRLALPHDLQLHRRLPAGHQVTNAIEEVKRALLLEQVSPWRRDLLEGSGMESLIALAHHASRNGARFSISSLCFFLFCLRPDIMRLNAYLAGPGAN